MKFRNLVRRNKNNIAFIVGNGINRFDCSSTGNSWEDLLIDLWNTYNSSSKSAVPQGISETEFFDLLQLKISASKHSINLSRKFCDLMSDWKPAAHHRQFVDWAANNKSPVLTTNFENTLGEAGDCRFLRVANSPFTDFYPWGACYAKNEVKNPAQEFAIWHINGMQKYQRSVRLGLTHYMGAVERARKWFYQGKDDSLFFGRKNNKWKGADTWLQIIFNKPLAIFGLGLGQTEVFLRWLLIERAKFFTRYPDRFQKAWYVHVKDDSPPGKLLFLKSLGIEPVALEQYEEIYSDPW